MKALSSLFLTLFTTGALALVVSAQPPPPMPPLAVPVPDPNPNPMVHLFNNGRNAWHLQMQSHSRAAELVQQLVKTENEDQKGKIREKLTEVLNQIFDEHMQQQQKELEELEKQIANLRSIMKKRAAAKNDIVERRIEQMIDDAKGLGWSTPGSSHFNLQHSFPFTNLTGIPGTPKEATSKEPARKKKSEASKDKDRKKSDDEDDDEKGKDRKKSEDDNDNE
jgi:hypothetical protein